MTIEISELDACVNVQHNITTHNKQAKKSGREVRH